jgi:hypothetical protein
MRTERRMEAESMGHIKEVPSVLGSILRINMFVIEFSNG